MYVYIFKNEERKEKNREVFWGECYPVILFA